MLKPISDFRIRNHWLHLIFIILIHNLPKLVINTAKVDFKHPIYSGNLPQTHTAKVDFKHPIYSGNLPQKLLSYT